MGGFYRKRGGARELLTEENKKHLCGGRRELEGFLSCRLPLSLGIESFQVTVYLTGVDQKIPDWLIKAMFL